MSPSTVLVLSSDEVRSLLPMRDCVEVMSGALTALTRGEATLPVRSLMWLPDRSGLLGMMPAYLGIPRIVGIKVITVIPGNHGTPYDSHQGAVLLFEGEHGRLLAIVEASSLTAIRTAAVSAAATRALASPGAGDLAILGSGVQAVTHLEAMRAVLQVRRVRVWSRNEASARAFARRESRGGLAVEPVGSAREAAEGADVICTVTSSPDPVLSGEWISPGAHVNAVGACVPTQRELDTTAVAKARVFVDDGASALQEAGDLLIPMREGATGASHIVGTIGAVILGMVEGRLRSSDVTLFKSLGVGVEDLAAAHHVYRGAVAAGRGAQVEWGGQRHAAD